jgi:hypothetical protein
MPQPTDVANVCCAAIELSKSSWVIAFSPPAGGGRAVFIRSMPTISIGSRVAWKVRDQGRSARRRVHWMLLSALRLGTMEFGSQDC